MKVYVYKYIQLLSKMDLQFILWFSTSLQVTLQYVDGNGREIKNRFTNFILKIVSPDCRELHNGLTVVCQYILWGNYKYVLTGRNFDLPICSRRKPRSPPFPIIRIFPILHIPLISCISQTSYCLLFIGPEEWCNVQRPTFYYIWERGFFRGWIALVPLSE